jgi:predicted dienelactone hydrolase
LLLLCLSTSPVSAATPASALATVSLPAPSGPHAIGTVNVRLVDRSRPDPWGVAAGQPRRLMVSIWYPARNTTHFPVAPMMQPGAAAGFDRANSLQVPTGAVNWAAIKTDAHLGAPLDRRGGPHPVVLYSPGAGDPRTLGTVLVEQLASEGYVVVTIDHTYETYVQFPDGTVTGMDAIAQAPQQPDGPWAQYLHKLVNVRVADTRFVLGQIARIDSRDRRFAGGLDLSKIGMFGQSAGGFTAVQAMHDDSRIKAAIDMDGELNYAQEDIPGTPMSSVVDDGLDRPFMLMGSKPDGRHNDENASWNLLWNHSTGWHRDLYLTGSAHGTYTDAEAIVPQLVAQQVITPEVGTQDVGTVRPGPAIAADRAYVTAFFDTWLRHRYSGLLNGPSQQYPDMTFVK